ncbi:MAG: SPFH domain-containing protein [Verrucomicrobiota bacterium]
MDFGTVIFVSVLAVFVLGLFIFFASRFRRCPSDKILVVYGSMTGSKGASARCYHGGATFIVPVIQDFQYLDLTPIPIDIELKGALSQQNIRVNTPSTFMVGISTEPGVMENAAERLLGLSLQQVRDLARDIIFGQMRVVIATMPIEEINSDRDKMVNNISTGVEVELKKVGLRLINVNVQDITDESGYIDALGREAAARAINDAKIKVAEQERDGDIGAANAQRDQRISVADANAKAVEGENVSKIEVAQSEASRREAEAEAERRASAAEKVKAADALREAYASEQAAETERAKKEQATQYANVVVPAEIEKQRIETLAEADAEKTRRLKKGEADGIYALLEAEARGQEDILSKKASGLEDIVKAGGGDPHLAALLMVTEELPELVKQQVRAISNLKIDSVTVWESGGRNGDGSSTADFMKGLVGALPPLHDLTKNVGVQLPEYLGKLDGGPAPLPGNGAHTPPPVPATDKKKADADAATVIQEIIEEAPETPPPGEDDPSPSLRVREWVEQNLVRLTSFDLNKDSKLDEEEINKAVGTAQLWAGKLDEPGANWYYAAGGKADGPHPWDKIQGAGRDNSKVFISYKQSHFWLPFEVIELAARD